MSKVNSKKAANSKKKLVKLDKEFEYADVDCQTYGIIERALGMCRFSIACVDGKTRKGCVRGSIQKKSRVEANDVVIVSLRDFDDSTCDIIYMFDAKGAARLRKEGLIPDEVSRGSVHSVEEAGVVFDFDSLADIKEEVVSDLNDPVDLEDI